MLIGEDCDNWQTRGKYGFYSQKLTLYFVLLVFLGQIFMIENKIVVGWLVLPLHVND